jgi:hypothetical protein
MDTLVIVGIIFVCLFFSGLSAILGYVLLGGVTPSTPHLFCPAPAAAPVSTSPVPISAPPAPPAAVPLGKNEISGQMLAPSAQQIVDKMKAEGTNPDVAKILTAGGMKAIMNLADIANKIKAEGKSKKFYGNFILFVKFK